MNLNQLLLGLLLQLNRFLFNWSSAVLPKQNPRNLKIKANQTSQKQYQYTLQEFVLLKTKYQVFTKAINRVSSPQKDLFEVKILD